MAQLGFGQTFGRVFSGPDGAMLPATLSLHGGGDLTPAHEHASAYVCVVLSGGFTEAAGRDEVERRAGEALAHPRGAIHSDRFGPGGAECLNIHLPAGWAAPAESARRLPPDARSLTEALACEIALARDCTLSADSLAAEVLAWLGGADDPGNEDWVLRVVEALADAPDEAWTLEDLAAIARRHPTQTARGFRRRTGLSIGAWRRRRRLTRLALDLRQGADSLADLAARHGYADQAHMTREFRAAAGHTPGAFRRRAR